MKIKSISIILLALTWLTSPPASAQAQHFGEWSAPANIGPPVNVTKEDWQPFLTKNGLSLYFVHGVSPNARMWVAKRATRDDQWGAPELLPATINSGNVGYPYVTPDEHTMYFNTNLGIVRSWRQNKKMESGPGSWQAPEVVISTASGGGRMPWLFENEETGETVLYFVSDRYGTFDLFESRMLPDGSFGPVELVAGAQLNTAYVEAEPSVSHNGRELYFTTNRPGSMLAPNGTPSRDIWVAKRESSTAEWSDPVPVTVLNSPFHDGRASLLWDGGTIIFFSARPGNVDSFFDLWQATREKVASNVEP